MKSTAITFIGRSCFLISRLATSLASARRRRLAASRSS